jgi:hypothetical protein
MVRRILYKYNENKQNNCRYDGYDKRKNNTGKHVVIEPGSYAEALIADWLEDNMGFRQTTAFLNQHRVEEGRIPVSKSAIMSAFDRMRSKIDKIEKTVQRGCSDAWIEARLRQTK